MGEGAYDADCWAEARAGLYEFWEVVRKQQAAKNKPKKSKAQKKREAMFRAYDANKTAPIGSEIRCCVCGKVFTKRTPPQAFCSAKSKCRHFFHNSRPDRLARTLDRVHNVDT